MAIDTGLLHNLETEFDTTDKDVFIKKLYDARVMLGAELNLACHDRDLARADAERKQGAIEAMSSKRSAEYADLRQQRDDARVVVAQVTEANEFLANAAGTAAAERDRARQRLREVAAELAHQQDAYDHACATIRELVDLWDSYEMTAALSFDVRERAEAQALDLETERDEARANLLMEAAIADRLYLANLRLKRACLAWYEAAQEAQDAQTSGPRDADVAALVTVLCSAKSNLEAFQMHLVQTEPDDVGHCPACGPEDYCYNHELQLNLKYLIPDIDAALRPFRRVAVPVLGDVEDHNGLQNHIAWRMTPEDVDASMPRALEAREGE